MNELKTFQELEYVRPNFEELKAFYNTLCGRIKAAQSYEDVRACMMDEEKISSHFNTMAVIVQIRHTVDTSDEFYEKEDEYIIQYYPELMPPVQAFNSMIVAMAANFSDSLKTRSPMVGADAYLMLPSKNNVPVFPPLLNALRA